MRASRGEIKIEEILEMAGLNYREEVSFADLISETGVPLRFDFGVYDDNDELMFLIEFQGIQHYKPKSKFGGIAGLRRQQYRDMQKRQYCKKHNIILIAIPYVDEFKMNYDYIMGAYFKEFDKN